MYINKILSRKHSFFRQTAKESLQQTKPQNNEFDCYRASLVASVLQQILSICFAVRRKECLLSYSTNTRRRKNYVLFSLTHRIIASANIERKQISVMLFLSVSKMEITRTSRGLQVRRRLRIRAPNTLFFHSLIDLSLRQCRFSALLYL